MKKNEKNVTFGRNVRLIRKYMQNTQPEFAELVGVSVRTIAHWELGNIPGTPNFMALVGALKGRLPFELSHDGHELMEDDYGDILRGVKPGEKIGAERVRVSSEEKSLEESPDERWFRLAMRKMRYGSEDMPLQRKTLERLLEMIGGLGIDSDLQSKFIEMVHAIRSVATPKKEG